MTLRQTLLFVVLCTASVTALVIGAGKWEAPATHGRPSGAPTPPTKADDVEEISIPSGLNVSGAENLFVEAPPEPIEFEDPEHPGYRIRIPYFVAWKFHANSLLPTAKSTEGDEVGVLCRDVTLQMFRRPKTHDEALALKKGDRKPVLVRIFKAKEARVHGRIASQLREKEGSRPRVDADRNSLVHLTKDVFIDDIEEGLEITGSRVKVWPKLGKATGTGTFEVEHEAFVITGTGMKLEKLDSGRTLIEIMEQPNLRLVNELQADSRAGDLFQVQEGEFREATIRSTGRALIRRDDSGPQEQLNIDMRGDVRMNQEGGRSLDADRLTVLALKEDAPDAPTEARSKGWRLRRLTADGHVNLKFLDETDPKAAKLFGATTDHLTHRVPTAGVPTTLMEGPTRITFEGDVPIDGGARKNGVVHAYARERVWIGPVSGYEPPPGVKVESLRRVILEQEASVKRFGATAKNNEYDELEGDRIEVVFVTTEALALGPKKTETPAGPVKQERGGVQALEFLATGNVRLGGSRVEGRMDSLRALNLHGATPLLVTKGERTWLRFSGIGENQRLLGANEQAPATPGPLAAPSTPKTPGVTAQKRVKPTWRLRRLQATGEVDVTTSLGGPSLGMPLHVMGDQITYDALRGLAELDGGAGRVAQIHAEARGGQRNELKARHLSFDRNAALVHAKGAVRADLWTPKSGTRSGGLRDSFKSAPKKKATALEIRTDAPIQVHFVRKPGATGVQEGAEQRIDIDGPLSASLQSDDDTIDRLRANRLDVALVLSSEPGARRRPARPTTPASRAPTHPAPKSGRGAAPRPAPAPALTKVSLEAREVTTTLVDGAADVFTATGKVLLQNEMGRIQAERLVYRARDRSADVTGTAREQARAHFKDKAGLPNHVSADHFAMRWGEEGLERITAAGSESRPVLATLLDAGSKNSAPGLQATPRAPGELQRFKIRSHGRLVLEATNVTAYDVWITQQRSRDRGRTWTRPAHIYAQRMIVRGRGLLGSGETPRSVESLDAEQVDLAGKETYFTTVGKDGKAEIWGHTFHFDVAGELLTLRGRKDKPVRFTQGTKVDMYYRSAGWNLRTGLPVLEGHRAVLSGKR